MERAENNVLLRDSIQNTLITGAFAEHFERTGLSTVTGQAMLTVISHTDSLFLHADTLKSVYYEQDDERWIFAYPQGQVLQRGSPGSERFNSIQLC
jgi:hypothetical protein